MATQAAIPVPHMQRLLDDIARREGFRRPRYTVSAGSKAGDNYLGVLFRVEVTEGAEGAAATPSLQLIFKGMPSSAKRRQEMHVATLFDNEYYMHREVLPALTRFLAESGDALVRRGPDTQPPAFPFAPRCVDATRDGVEGEDTLVMEDMRPLGFTMHDRRQGLDEEHVGVVFRSLAYLHAASFAMEAERPDAFGAARDLLTETLFTPDNTLNRQIGQIAVRTYDFVVDRFPEDSEGYAKLKAFIDDFPMEMSRLVEPRPAGGNAITHGDCWTNNLLFRYSEGGAVEEACLLDFQLSRYASPVLDLLYLVYSCTDREMRDRHLDGLLREYHDELGAALRRLGLDLEQVYPWHTMQAQLRERGKYGLGMAIITVPLFLADTDEIPDLDAQFESGKPVSDIFAVESKSAPARNKRICDVLQELMDRGWM